MIREHRGSLKVEKRLGGPTWVLRFKTTRECDHRRIERTRVVARVKDFPTKDLAFAEAERLRLYTIEPGSRRGTLTFSILAEFYLQELKKVPESKKRKPKAASTIEDRERIIRKRLLPRFGERDALKLKPSEIKAWLESVQDEEDLENSTVDKIRRVMNLVYSMAQASDLIQRTVDANPVKHVHIATTTGYEAILVTPQDAWNIICRMEPFARLMTLLIAVTGLRIGEVLAFEMEARRLDQVPDPRRLQLRQGQVWRTEVSCLEEACGVASACHGFAEKLARDNGVCRGRRFSLRFRQTQRQSTSRAEHAGRRPSSTGGQTGDRDSIWSPVRLPQPSACVNLVPGGDRNRFQDMLRWADPSILLKVYAHSRMDKRMEAQAKMIEAMGLNEQTVRHLM
jgi:hypothetical protein